jgi:shikimate kinase
MLATVDPAATMRQLLAERSPVYAQADLTVPSREVPHEASVTEIVNALTVFLDAPLQQRVGA